MNADPSGKLLDQCVEATDIAAARRECAAHLEVGLEQVMRFVVQPVAKVEGEQGNSVRDGKFLDHVTPQRENGVALVQERVGAGMLAAAARRTGNRLQVQE